MDCRQDNLIALWSTPFWWYIYDWNPQWVSAFPETLVLLQEKEK